MFTLLTAALLIANFTAQGERSARAWPLTLRGYVSRSVPVFQAAGKYRVETRPEADARVSLCPTEGRCEANFNTVTDAGGFFVLVASNLAADKKYLVLVRPIGSSQKMQEVGSPREIAAIKEPISIELRGEADRQFDKHVDVYNKKPVNAQSSVLFATDRGIAVKDSKVEILNSNATDAS